ncbi:hypothetical protein BOTBODRAFT_251633 [Botryobasidium botryosum FD-172 SS1]|uniref:F-box domain-containing protein n=1 Tax=Botryobasidium botryosum (strain FD-172 SS1) TaxID=930990 RepID=A0A067MYB7_BOTB1|nr:hypothetical protein BOTBODRAFT_251633 [Botryobasidium botryosum FD-172 SS1]
MESATSELLSQLMQTLVEHIRVSRSGINDSNEEVIDPVRSTSEVSRSALDEEIKLFELAVEAIGTYSANALAALRSRRNETTPVYRLPNEILSSIFEGIGIEDIQSTSPLEAPINVAGVSKVWRSVAFNTPSLWKLIKALPLGLVPTFLDRSKQSGLDIFIDYTKQPRGACRAQLALLVPHADRWRSLLVQLGTVSRTHELNRYLKYQLPRLEALCFFGSDPVLDIDETGTLQGIPRENAPRLRQLCLDSTYLPLSSPLFSDLTFLLLSNISYTSPDAGRRLLGVIDACPLLQNLSLTNLYFIDPIPPNPNDTPPPPAAPIHLPDLRFIRFSNLSLWVIRSILSRIVTQAYCQLFMSTRLLPRESPRDILPATVQNLHNIRSVSSLEVSVIGRGRDMRIHGSVPGSIGTFTIVMEDEPMGHTRIQRTLLAFAQHLPLPLESLKISGFQRRKGSASIMPQILSHFPQLAEITFDGCHKAFIEALVISATRHVCPRLERLQIDFCTITDTVLIDLMRSRIFPPRDPVARSSFTNDAPVCPLNLLRLYRCRKITMRSIPRLQEYARMLAWVLEGQLDDDYHVLTSSHPRLSVVDSSSNDE